MAAAGAAAPLVVVAAVAAAMAEPPPSARLPSCLTTGPITGLSVSQAENARIVTATADARLGPDAAVIAVMTALAESGLRVLANPNDPSGQAFANQGIGYDHDSLGLFQQRPSWGTAGARMDPASSTNLFLDALQAHDTWREEPPWTAAQRVQRSAFDGTPSAANGGSAVYGGNYLAQYAHALQIVLDIGTSAALHQCGVSLAADNAPGPPASFGLPTAYQIPAQTSMAARLALTFAIAQLGKPYLWGGTGPDRYDCSGLTQAAWRAGGVELGRTTWDQLSDGTASTIDALRPGDLVLVPGSDGSPAAPGHLGLYLGHGLVIHAPKTGDVVRVTGLTAFVRSGLSGIRHIA